MLEELFKNILDSDVVKKVTKNLGENEIVNKVKEAVAGNDYAKKLQEGLSSGDLLNKIKTGAQTAGREATKISLECYQVMTAETTPTVDKVIIGAALAYQFMPNLMNRDNFGPILSLLDNAPTKRTKRPHPKKPRWHKPMPKSLSKTFTDVYFY